MSAALILAGHGSHISPNTARIVWNAVDRLRQLAVADEITACFWKEPPAFSQVIATVEAPEAVVMPVFTAQGYFADEVIPTEMGLTGALTEIGGKRIHLTPSIGSHSHLEQIVEARLRRTLEEQGLDPADTAAAIIGHGTPRNCRSRDAAREQADKLRELNWLREAVAVYLDDEPDIPSVYRSTTAPHLVALPYFVASGSHVTMDLPRALGMSGTGQPEQVAGRTVYFCQPVGEDESLSQIALDLARETGLPFHAGAAQGAWTGFPSVGRADLLDALRNGDSLRFGQLLVNRERVRPVADSREVRRVTSPSELRRIVRESPFRPLPTRLDLPTGWQVDLARAEDAAAVIETVYPGLLADWAAQRRGMLETESLADIGTRQSGMFKDIHRLPPALIETTTQEICGACAREPAWRTGAATELPCRGPCNVWLSAARTKEKEAI